MIKLLDENNNGVLDKNILGFPTEVYGFSRNVREFYNAPDLKMQQSSLFMTIEIKID